MMLLSLQGTAGMSPVRSQAMPAHARQAAKDPPFSSSRLPGTFLPPRCWMDTAGPGTIGN
jgi:hypothetical protein